MLEELTNNLKPGDLCWVWDHHMEISMALVVNIETSTIDLTKYKKPKKPRFHKIITVLLNGEEKRFDERSVTKAYHEPK